jgi:hypothetical protein
LEKICNEILEILEILEKKQNDFTINKLKPNLIENDKEKSKSFIETILIPETIKSRDWLMENIDSPLYHIFFKNYPNSENLSAHLSKHLKESGKWNDFEHHIKVKYFLVDIGYNYFLANITKSLQKNMNNITPGSFSEEPFELIIYKETLDENKRLENNLAKLDDHYEKTVAEIRNENKLLSDNNWELKTQLSTKTSELELLKSQYFFYQDDLFKKYIFGDKLPNLHGLFQLLRQTKTYNGNWGSFCYCITYANAKENEPMKLELNLLNSEMTYKDLGFILYKLNKSYKYETELPFSKWIFKIVKIISKHGNILEAEEDIQIFIKKNFRPYINTKSLPRFYESIIKEFDSFE